ncbi:enoyl-CoA-hydratase DpgB [Streptacidiphilus jiangxiensis]|uniref:Isomerase DpgB n=1 Tax=Streptacidiphilus jiangxiensis TaxID=235985 RepID=A0A1H7UM43_STRJI|nr:enoyl-CoA-hydratase DpgB [Streptacidiphilus jiangxiensis]SEL97815.1 isomerase DpgB [Streptacidiphilus jiangxiensis]
MNSTPAPQLTLDGSQPLTPATVQALSALCDAAEDLPGAAAPLVVTVAGAPATRADVPLPLVNKWERAVRRLEKLAVPTVALVTGDCGGTALDVLLATDVRIATPDARLVPLAGADTDERRPDEVWPGMALYRLANQAGIAATRRAVLFGDPIDAERACALHLFDELAADPAAALGPVLDKLKGGAGTGIRRQLMLDAGTTSYEEALGRHLAACDRTLRAAVEAAS